MVRRIVAIIYAESKGGERTLRSLLRQNTPLDQIIYIDDGIESAIDKKSVDYHKSQKKLGFLHHLYTTVHQLADEEVVILINGGEELTDEKVVGTLKTLYDQEGVWITHGGQEGLMKSFYAKVFKKLHITQFLSEGVFAKE